MKHHRIGKAACLLIAPILFAATTASQAQNQHPIIDKLAAKVIQKYQGSSCQQLKMKKAEDAPPSAQEQKVIAYLKSDPQSRAIFLNKVAAPIANKMFECGMIP